MLHVNHLLCLISGTSPPSAAHRQAVYLADSLGAALHVMPIGGDEAPDDLREAWKTSPDTNSIEGTVVPSPGPADRSIGAIRGYVEEKNVDLVVVDSTENHEPVPPLGESFREALMKELNQPVYVVGKDADPEAVRRILVPTDLSDHSLVALKHAAGLASVYGSSIALLHVIDRSPYVALTTMDRLSLQGTTLPEHRARRQLQEFVQAGQLADVSIRPHLKFGDPVEQISAYIDRGGIDLVVLSSHGTMTHPDRPFGKVAEQVLQRIRVPLFLVKSFGRSLLSQERSSETMSESGE